MRVWDCPKPVIAQVHGYCLAGGLELAMACDLIVAAEGTQLGEPEIRYGSAPVTLLMPALIGQKKTRELLLTGDLIDAAEAERIGLVNRVVPADRLAAEVDALADRIARTPPEILRLTKQMLNRAMDAAGLRTAVAAGLDLGAIINAAGTPEQTEWDEIVRRDGLKAALAWRDRRYEAGRADRSEDDGPPPERAALHSPPCPRRPALGGPLPICSSRASRPRRATTSSRSPARRRWTSSTRSAGPTASVTSRPATSRAPRSWPTSMAG